jgi:phosphatidylglycerophosphate synthase
MRRLPLLLTLLRALLAPLLVWLALDRPSPVAFGVCLTAAFLSDVSDGIVARRLGVATPNLRRLDSFADSLFYLAAVFAVWHLDPEAILNRTLALLALATLEIGRYALDWVKFGREASYHMWSSKLWGIALFACFFDLLVLGHDGIVVDVAICLGIAADLEGMAISLTLKRWQSDVPSLFHAIRIRTLSGP